MLAMTQSDHDMSQIVTGDAGSMMQLCKQHCMSVPAVAPPQPDAIMLHSVAISVLRAPVALPHGLTCAPFDRPPKLLV